MKKNRKLLWILVALLLIAAYRLIIHDSAEPEVSGAYADIVMLDVGQADCLLISSGGRHMLIDAGNRADGDAVVSELKSRGIGRLDVVIGTHPHEDHIGGMAKVLNEFDIGTFYMPYAQTNTKTFEDTLDAALTRGLSITAPEPGSVDESLLPLEIRFLAPVKEYKDLNNASIVVKAGLGAYSALFTGDAERESEEDMLSYWGTELSAYILKVAHHGSSSSGIEQFISRVSPSIALISVGEGNSYGHPAESTLARLRGKGAEIYRTDTDGAVTVRMYADSSKAPEVLSP